MARTAQAPTRPAGLPSEADILGRAGGENFPVASRALAAKTRRNLLSIYGYARLVDQLGDDYAGDRLVALDWVEAEVTLALRDPDRRDLHPLVTRVATTVRRVGSEPGDLYDLIEANRRDQRQSRYATFAELQDYCRLSANPVGRLVLAAFEQSSPAKAELSDRICTGLQLAEHWQDVAEDARAGRVYLPQDDLAHFDVDEADLRASSATRAVRALLVFEVARARRLLDEGAPLVGLLAGRARWAVAGFVAGGYAALDAVAAANFDPLASATRPGALDTARNVWTLLKANRPVERTAA